VALLLAVALASLAAASAPRVLAQSVDYPGGEGDMPAHVYGPEGAGPFPGVLVLHTLAGPGPNVEAFARRLAGQGFITMTPDLFSLHEFGPDGRADHPLVLKDLNGALTYFRAHPRVDRSRLGVVGFSFGGRMAVLAAAGHPDLRAAVVYYAIASYQDLARERPVAGRALRTRPATELAPSIGAAILIHHGEADRSVPVGQGILLHRALHATGKPSTLHLYPDADHLFNFEIAQEAPSAFHPEAARLSWERTVEFLKRHLQP
jgi:carboxymethylenebutenolidase